MKKENYTDHELVDGIQNQDSDVILYMYKKNYRSVKHYIEKNNGSEKDAEDVFQEAMIFLHDKIRKNQLKLNSSIHTYLFGVSKIYWLRGFEKKKRLVYTNVQTEIAGNENFLDDMIILERKKIFLDHFNELSKDCQKLIGLFIKNVSIGEITNIMGYGSDQFTRNKRLRCKKSLLEKITHNPYFKNLTNERIGKNNQVPPS